MHYPQERWFAPTADGKWPEELLNPELHAFYNPGGEIDDEVLADLNSGNVARGICALPYTRLRDGAQTFIPVNIIGNLYVSNGMAAGNTPTEEDYNWLVACIHGEGKDIYVADFSEQGAYGCRILVPGMSEIDPAEDLEWENNSVGNAIRPALVRLSELSEAECAELLSDLQTMNLNDERPLWEIPGLAIPVGKPWKQLRIGELKTLLALAIGDEDAIHEGCDWIHHFNDLAPARRLVYRCIESMLNVDNVDDYRRSLVLLYGADTERQAEALLNRNERFFGLDTLGPDMQGSAMHRTLLEAYDKLFAPDRVPGTSKMG